MKAGTAELPWKKAAMALVACFLVGYAVQLGVTVLDRGDLESVVQPSAVGDSSYFAVPETLAVGDALATYEGQTLVAAARAPEKASSFSMIRIGREDSGAFDVYRAGDESDETLRDVFFLKTAPRRFLRVRVAEAAPE